LFSLLLQPVAIFSILPSILLFSSHPWSAILTFLHCFLRPPRGLFFFILLFSFFFSCVFLFLFISSSSLQPVPCFFSFLFSAAASHLFYFLLGWQVRTAWGARRFRAGHLETATEARGGGSGVDGVRKGGRAEEGHGGSELVDWVWGQQLLFWAVGKWLKTVIQLPVCRERKEAEGEEEIWFVVDGWWIW
jgi:hypothetical protein